MDTKNERTEPENRPKSDMDAKPQARRDHPEEWERDLAPDRMAGQNIGQTASDAEQELPTAYDVKEVHRMLNDRFTDDELRQIPILPAGSRLEQGATYLDQRDPERRELRATGGMTAGPDDLYVPKDRVPYPIWNRLRGIDDPERTDGRGDAGR